MKLIDCTGQRFGRMLVLERGENAARGQARWTCRCDCGRITLVPGGELRRGRSLSCGCLNAERVRVAHTTHGHAKHRSRTAEYRAWTYMLNRCHNPNASQYQYYGARGITVCDHWRRSYEAFLFWVGPRPSPAHSLDRIDNDGDYEPGNVKWSTAQEQRNNRRPQRRRERAT